MRRIGLAILLYWLAFHCLALETCFADRLTFDEPHIPGISSHAQLLGVSMDTKGRLWLGTENGIVLYDGYRTSNLRYQPGSKEGLAFPITSRVYESDDYFFISHDSLTKSLIDKTSGKITHAINPVDPDKKDFPAFRTVLPNGETFKMIDKLPVTLGNELHKFDYKDDYWGISRNGQLERDPMLLKLFLIHAWDKRISRALKFNNQYVAISSFNPRLPLKPGGNFYRFNPDDFKLEQVMGLSQFAILDIEIKDAVLYALATDYSETFLLELNSQFAITKRTRVSNKVSRGSFHFGPSDSLWLYLNSGRFVQICNGELLDVLTNGLSQPNGPAVHATSWDVYNRLWLVRPQGGLLQGRLLPPYLRLFDKRNSELPTDETRSTLQLDEQRLVVATQDQGIYILDSDSGQLIEDITPEKGQTAWRSLYIDSKQYLWASGYYGLWRRSPDGDWQQLDQKQSFGLYADGDHIWQLGYRFLNYWSLANEQPILERNLIQKQAVRAAANINGRWLFGLHAEVGAAAIKFIDPNTGTETFIHDNQPINRYPFVLKTYKEGFLLGSWGGGLQYFSTEGELIWQIAEQQGLPSNIIYGIEQDEQQRLWLSTDKGLAVVRLCDKGVGQQACIASLNIIDEDDGLPCSEFDSEATYKAANGDLYFGGLCGVVKVTPSAYQPEQTAVTPFIANIRHADKPLPNSSVFNVPYLEHLPELGNGNDVQLSFAAAPLGSMVGMRYRLNQSEWQHLAPPFDIYLNHLPFGATELEYQATNQHGEPLSDIHTVSLSVFTPWYATRTARFGYVVLAIMALVLLIHYRQRTLIRRNESLNKLVMQKTRQLADANVELHDALAEQQRMLEYLSHELRTPLSLMLLPIYQIKQQVTGKLAQLSDEAERAGQRLNQFIDQLLQIGAHSRGDSPSSYVPVFDTLQSIVSTYRRLAEDKQQQLTLAGDDYNRHGFWQKQSFELIVSNLLSNAIKYSPIGAKIDVALVYEEQTAKLTVMNHGTTISAAASSKIFERRFRDNSEQVGSGLGLHIVKDLCQQLGGEIVLNIEPDAVSFTASLPITVTEAVAEPLAIAVEHQQPALLLLVEDDAELRRQLAAILRSEFEVATAVDGCDALSWLQQNMPDLIISDVQMPRLNGIDLTKQLKSDARFAHIPMLLLSAWADESNKMAGMMAEANDYMVKPIAPPLLLSKCRNLLNTMRHCADFARAQLQQEQTEDEDSLNVALQSKSDGVLQQVLTLIDDGIAKGNSDMLSVEYLANAVHLSSRQLNRYCVHRYQSSLSQIITLRRMRHAKQLLETSSLPISLIADRCGYATASHFNKVFKEHYQQTPSAFRQRMGQKSSA
ncbi:response regulator [Shewanella avicenniae]|uniref:histidine kinase n=1 Tax=Shewanella avicenniae TaxID=2814294 RepID=A0ABX7QRS5_9GAMM|nr:response regulator [Shewanella avicenniae]QSX33396.1 response regulator [Shewanella avicenniae]